MNQSNNSANGQVADSAKNTGIEVNTGFMPLSFFLFFCSPVIEINGQKNRSSWGKRFFDLPEGEYIVTVYFPYMFWKRCGENSITVRVASGQVEKISFYAPLVMTSKGSIKSIK